MQADLKLGAVGLAREMTPAMTPGADAAQGQAPAAGAQATGKVLPPSSPEAGEASGEALQGAVKRLSDYLQRVRRELQFSVDEASGRTVIRVIDASTEEVIRQIPPEEVLALARYLDAGEPRLVETKA